jgi:hypothetical protein
MTSLAESQAFLDQFDKCLPLCERGDAVTVINALHTLNSITKASIQQAIELGSSAPSDFVCTFLVELELALELHTAPVPRLGTIDGGLPELYSFTDEELAALSKEPSPLTKGRVRKFLQALGESPSPHFDSRSVADTVVAFLKCQVKPTSNVAQAQSTRQAKNISWADMCSSGSECDSDSDVPGLEDESDCESDFEDEVQVSVKPARAEAARSVATEAAVQRSVEDSEDEEVDEDEEAARIFLWATPSKTGDCWFPDEASSRSDSHSDDEPRRRALGKDDPHHKTRMCAHFQKSGHCHFGERCNFAHGSEELRVPSEAVSGRKSAEGSDVSETASTCSSVDLNALLGLPDYKTRICRNFQQTGACKYGDRCNFAHGKEELMGSFPVEKKKEAPKNLFKTKLCSTFETKGSCWYGASCSFAHGKAELRK